MSLETSFLLKNQINSFFCIGEECVVLLGDGSSTVSGTLPVSTEAAEVGSVFRKACEGPQHKST